MFIVTSSRDKFTHRVGDIDSLEDLLFGFTDDKDDASRIAKIAGMMSNHDVFVGGGFAIFITEDRK